ncbi:MAG: S-methyl-5-thioribose-1-phosphate isomerase [Oscillospiraceae bacterium]
MKNIMNYETVSLSQDNSALVIIDQTQLPYNIELLNLTTQKQVWDAIYLLQVRGAPAIGVAAAYGIYLGAREIEADNYADFYAQFKEKKDYLASARPTAVNLFWALDRMERIVTKNSNRTVPEIKQLLLDEANEMKAEDIRVCSSIGDYGVELIKDGYGILTHCNAGQLATVKYGTAIAPIYKGVEKGYKLKVFTDETRPLLQGARLSAFELHSSGVDTTVICDNMASIVMKNGWVQIVFVGADRIAANGDAANKIGTSGVAILAKFYGIPFYVCAPLSTFDLNCKTGEDIHIEERPAEEVTEMWYKERMAPEGVKVYNPAFDVTDHNNITGIITEYGIATAPFEESIKEMFRRKDEKKV